MASDTQPRRASREELWQRLGRLSDIATAVGEASDTQRLTERILLGAKEVTRADGGTLYLLNEEKTALDFHILRNDTLAVAEGGTEGGAISLGSVLLYQADGSANYHNVAAYVAHTGETVNIADAYSAEGFDFSGTQRFDAQTGYRSTSFLTLPLRDYQGRVIGVLQLINALDSETGAVTTFPQEDEDLVAAFAAQASAALSLRRLVDLHSRLFERFAQVLATALDRKSEHTGGHCQRVPVLTEMIADAAHRTSRGPMADFALSDEGFYELRVAAWLHDCGKVATPEWVMEKATKLHTLHDGIDTIDARADAVRKELERDALAARLEALQRGEADPGPDGGIRLTERLQQLEADRALLHQANQGQESMDEASCDRIRQLGALYTYERDGEQVPVVSESEVVYLTVSRGTLTEAERAIIQDHVRVTEEMLSVLPFPEHLQRVPELAASHHERMDGAGYHRGLTGEEMPPESQMVALADVFEALTATDRPYKEPKSLSQAITILGYMVQEGHISPDLFDTFMREGVYQAYADRYLPDELNDSVDLTAVPAFDPGTSVTSG